MNGEEAHQLAQDGTVARWARAIGRRSGAHPQYVTSLVQLMIRLAPPCPTEEHLRQLFAQIAEAADNPPHRSESITARMREYVRAGADPGFKQQEQIAA